MNEEKKTEEKGVSIALVIGMGAFILLTSAIALMLATPFEASDVKAFENPESMWNPVYFFVLIIVFTALILLLLRFRGERLIHLVMLTAVAVTIYYVMAVLVPYGIIALIITLALALLLYIYPEWYVLDATGLIIGGGVAAIFGISLGIIPVLLLMVILAIYDAIAVYKTKHMVSLAESVVDLRIPVLFVLPRKRNFSLLKDKGKSEMEEAFFMGLGDAIIPSLLVVSANHKEIISDFATYMGHNIPEFTYYFGLINAPALGALIGTLAGYAVLSRIAGRGKPHAGLPFLNSGAIIGFVIGFIFF